MISVTLGLPSVIVPVLSKTIVSILCVFSSTAPPLIKIPYSAPLPVPTIIAVGVANPKAHGQAINNTETKTVRINSGFCPAISQTKAAATAIAITIGTNIADILSASLAIGAFEFCVSSTRLIILASTVSSPTLVVITLIVPVVFILAVYTLSPLVFSIGMLSPVNIDSSIEVIPSITSPSTGTFSPGFTITISLTCISLVKTSTSCLSLIISAFFGAKSINFSKA